MKPNLLVDCYVMEGDAAANFLPLFPERAQAVAHAAIEPLPADPRAFSAMVITGSAASVVEPEPWVSALRTFVARALELDIPVLGVCFGHQMLAWARWGDRAVRRAHRPEVGWLPVQLSQPNPLMTGLQSGFVPFVSHQDEVIQVPDMSVFAHTEACAVHGFEVPGARSWGVQFHVEMAVEEVSQIAVYREAKHPDLGLKASELIAGYRDCRPIAQQIFDNFFRLAGSD